MGRNTALECAVDTRYRRRVCRALVAFVGREQGVDPICLWRSAFDRVPDVQRGLSVAPSELSQRQDGSSADKERSAPVAIAYVERLDAHKVQAVVIGSVRSVYVRYSIPQQCWVICDLLPVNLGDESIDRAQVLFGERTPAIAVRYAEALL